jgi:hypothetical protein
MRISLALQSRPEFCVRVDDPRRPPTIATILGPLQDPPSIVDCTYCGLPTSTDLEDMDGNFKCADCHFRHFPEDWD